MVRKTHFLRQFAGDPVQMTHQFPIIFRNVVDRCDFLFWNDQQVYRCLGINVPESQTDVVFVDDVCACILFL